MFRYRREQLDARLKQFKEEQEAKKVAEAASADKESAPATDKRTKPTSPEIALKMAIENNLSYGLDSGIDDESCKCGAYRYKIDVYYSLKEVSITLHADVMKKTLADKADYNASKKSFKSQLESRGHKIAIDAFDAGLAACRKKYLGYEGTWKCTYHAIIVT